MNITIDWGSYIISVPIIIGSVWAGIKFFSKSYVEQQFKKQLESHKHNLQLLVELNKFDIQRKMQDFNLYTTKRHEVYAKVYGLFLKAEGTAKSLVGFRSVPDFEKFSFAELEYYCEKNEIPLTTVKFILDNWDNNRSSSAAEMKAFYDRWYISKATKTYADAKNEYLLSNLYLSDDVAQICDKLSFIIGIYCSNLELFYDIKLPHQEKLAISKELRKAEEEITLLIESLKTAMQKEMAIGYYT